MTKFFTSRKFKKIIRIAPIAAAATLLTACGVPTSNFDTNSTIAQFNEGLVTALNGYLIKGNPKDDTNNVTTKNATNQNWFEGFSFTPSVSNVNLYDQQFCNTTKARTSQLNAVCTSSKVLVNGTYQYSFNYQKILSLYVDPYVDDNAATKVYNTDASLNKTTPGTSNAQNLVNSLYGPNNTNGWLIDKKPSQNFDFSVAYKDKTTNVINTIGDKKYYTNTTFKGTFSILTNQNQKMEIPFIIGINPANVNAKVQNSYDLFIAPSDTWKLTNN